MPACGASAVPAEGRRTHDRSCRRRLREIPACSPVLSHPAPRGARRSRCPPCRSSRSRTALRRRLKYCSRTDAGGVKSNVRERSGGSAHLASRSIRSGRRRCAPAGPPGRAAGSAPSAVAPRPRPARPRRAASGRATPAPSARGRQARAVPAQQSRQQRRLAHRRGGGAGQQGRPLSATTAPCGP